MALQIEGNDFLLTALKQVNMDTLDFALALVDWCEKNKCNGPGQRLSLVKLIEEWSEPRFKEYNKEIERVKGLLRVSVKNEIKYSYERNTENLPKLIELDWIQYKIENKL